MQKIYAIIFLFLFSTQIANAAIGNSNSGVDETFIIINNSGTTSFYDLYATTSNTDFQAANLGTFTCAGTLVLKGGQNKVYKCTGGDITSGTLFYRIYQVGNTPGSFNAINIGFWSEFTNGCGGKNQTWENGLETINILAGLGSGNYKIEVYSTAGTPNNSGNPWYASNNSANYIADFSVISPNINSFASQAFCSNQTGSILFTTNGGTPPLSVSHNGNSIVSPYTNLVGGNYTLTVADANGCTGTSVVAIAPIPPMIVINTAVTNPPCGDQVGSIAYTTSGGTGAIVVEDNGFILSSPYLVSAGNYILKAIDANGCTVTKSEAIFAPPILSINAFPVDATCFNVNGQLFGAAQGGITPYTITVNNTTYAQYYPAGTYTIKVTDVTGCTSESIATINQPADLVITNSYSPILCNGGTSFVTLSTSGGLPPYSGDGLQTNPLVAGMYTFTVSDANTCTKTTTVSITEPSPISITVIVNSSSLTSGDILNLNASASFASGTITISGPGAISSSNGILNTVVSTNNSGVFTITATDANACSTSSTLLIIVAPPSAIMLSAKVFLGGPFNVNNNLMNDDLRTKNLIPTVEPYSSIPFSSNYVFVNSGLGNTIGANVLAVSGNNAIVDWVFVELRNKNNASIVVQTQTALLQRDGDVVNTTDGVSPVLFSNTVVDNYFVSIRHRNHAGIMTSQAVSLLNQIDFTDINTALYIRQDARVNLAPLSGATQLINNLRLMYPGNANLFANSNSIISNNLNYSYGDRSAILNAPSATNVYSHLDLDLNGDIQFNLVNSDRMILNRTTLFNNSLRIFEQLP